MISYDAPSVALARLVLEKLEGNPSLEELKELKKEMARRKFHSPPMFLIRAFPKKREKEENEAELSDRKKQMKIIMEMVALKKLAYSMTSLYIYSEKMRKSLSKELSPHVPIKGDYVGALARLNYNAVLAFHDIYSILSTFGESKVSSYSLVEDAGLTYLAKEEYAKGMGLNIKKTKRRVKIIPLIRSPFVRKLLTATAVSFSYEEVTSTFEEDDEDLMIYNSLLHKHGIPPYSRIDNLESKEDLKEELASKGFGSFQEGVFSTDEELIGKLSSRRSYFFNTIKERASKAVAREILKSLKERTIPTMARNPSPIQLKALQYLDPSLDYAEVLS